MQCQGCGLGWWRWEAFDPAVFYDRAYFQSDAAAKGYSDYAALEPGVRRTARTRLRRIKRILAARAERDRPRPGSVVESPASLSPQMQHALLDLGCGTGIFLDEAGRAGFTVEGIEVSAYAAEQARARGLAVQCAPLDAIRIEPGGFDVVTLWDVIEHLPDPAATLSTAAAALQPGGVLALSTGDVTSLCARLSGSRWHLFTLPEHLYFFSPASLGFLLNHAGLQVERVTREVNWVPLGYIVERLSKTLTGRHIGLPLAALGRLVVPATLRDVLGVYAIKS